jgi:hypothetical protein
LVRGLAGHKVARQKTGKPVSRRILAGEEESIFGVLPQDLLGNLFKPASETAIVWNLIYPRARPTLSLASWMAIAPLAGTPSLREEDELTPFFWGHGVDGERLQVLEEALRRVDGGEARTEVDVILMGSRNVVVIEAKNLASLGRCTRYQHGRCPEIHRPPIAPGVVAFCRYWEGRTSRFTEHLEFGNRPTPNQVGPLCNRHYQLGRVLLVGNAIASLLDKQLHLWLLTSRKRWPALKGDWEDFTGRIRNDGLWRRSRALAWEQVATVPAR